MANYADVIKELRNKKGLSIRKFAEEIGTGPGLVQIWESGKSAPGSEWLQKLADYFDVSVDQILGRDSIDELDTSKLSDTQLEKLLDEPGAIFNNTGKKKLDKEQKKILIDIIRDLENE